MKKYAIGLDFGTNSCRSLIVDLSNGDELASHVFPYPTGEAGINCGNIKKKLIKFLKQHYFLDYLIT